MRRGPLFKSAVMIISVMFVLSFFAGCGEVEDYYGAASDYIEVSHPDTDTADVGNDSVDINTPSGTDSGDTAVTPAPDGSSSETGVTDDTAQDDQQDQDTQPSEPSGKSDINDKPIVDDDQGRVVDVP